MKAAAGREGEMPTTMALENTAQNPQERTKKKNILSEIKDDKSNKRNYSSCTLGNKDQKENRHSQAAYPSSHKPGFHPV